MNELDIPLVKLLIERTSYMNTYWNFYIVVSTAIVGVLASGKEFTRLISVKILLCIVFLLFAASNFSGIENLVDQRNALLGQLPSDFPADLKSTLEPKSYFLYLSFHLLLDVVVVVSILFVPWHSLSKKMK